MSIYSLCDAYIAACDWLTSRNIAIPTGGMVVRLMDKHYSGGWDSFCEAFRQSA